MKKAPPPEALTRIVRWIILLFFAYALLTGAFHFTPQKPITPTHPPVQTATLPADKDCSVQNGLDNFSILAPAFLPSRLPAIVVQDIKPGAGDDGAACGQHAAVEFEYALQDGTSIYKSPEGAKDDSPADKPGEIIGEGKLLHGLELGMLGMKPGAERRIVFPAALGFGEVKNPDRLLGSPFALSMDKLKQSVIAAKVSLVALSPELPSAAQPLRVIDHKFGGGARAQCGDKVRIEMTLWKLDGTKLFSTRDDGKPLVFTLGSSQVPFGIEQSVLDMTEDGERTVILPAAYVSPLMEKDEKSARNDPLTQLPREMLLAEIHVQHIGDEK